MIYQNIKEAEFIERPNRFIAYIALDGKREICHVKNTGRLRELLVPGACVYVQLSDKPERKTPYDLIAVKKGDKTVNIDSQAPNKVFGEWLSSYFKDTLLIKPEVKYKNSRFDFYVETKHRKIFIEVKGVTLEKNGTALFPDAPTKRGVKHINELCSCIDDGYEAYMFFVVQMENIKSFAPNKETHPEFAEALSNAAKKGLNIMSVGCKTGSDFLQIENFIEVRL